MFVYILREYLRRTYFMLPHYTWNEKNHRLYWNVLRVCFIDICRLKAFRNVFQCIYILARIPQDAANQSRVLKMAKRRATSTSAFFLWIHF